MPLSRRKIKCYVTFTNFIGTVFSVNLRIIVTQIIHQKKVSLFTTSLINLNDKSFHIKNAIVQGLKKLLKMQKWKSSASITSMGVIYSQDFLLSFYFYEAKQRCGAFKTCCWPSAVSYFNEYISKKMKTKDKSRLIVYLNTTPDFFFSLQSSNNASLNA